MSTAPAAADGHPQLGSTHKNGDRRFGIAGLYSSGLAGRGTPMLSSLYHSTVTEHIASVRVGDELRVQWRGTHWWATSDEGTVGRLSWPKALRDRTAYVPDGRSPYDFDHGTLYVQIVTVNAAGAVVDCGGYVVPDDYEPSDWPMTPMPDPAERESTVTIGLPSSLEHAVTPHPASRSCGAAGVVGAAAARKTMRSTLGRIAMRTEGESPLCSSNPTALSSGCIRTRRKPLSFASARS